MGISKHGKIFWLDIRVKGKRIRRSLRTENRNEALARYAPLREKLLEKHLGEKVKFSDFCQKYLDWAQSSKPASAPREEQRLGKIRNFFQGLEIVYLDEVTPYHIEQLKTELKARRLSRATINRYLQILRGLFYRAIDWEIYKKPNPLKKIRFYKEERTIHALSGRDMNRILDAAKNISASPASPLQKVFYDLCILALNTGMRKSEILDLEWKDIKGDEVEIIGKGSKRRAVPLNSTARGVIERQPKKNEHVFDLSNRHQADLFRRTIGQVRKKTGVDFHFHLLRHSFTTRLIEKGIDFVTVGELLGHSKISTSLIYSHTDKERKRKAVDLLI